MDSLGRRSGRQMARMRRQRSQEWREREFSSSENDDETDKNYRYVVDERVIQYEKDVKAGLDARGMSKVPAGVPLDRGRTGHSGGGGGEGGGGSGGGVSGSGGGSGIQTVENRTYAPLSGSEGDTETDNPQSPIQMLIHQPSPHLNLPSSLGRMILPLQRGPSTSSSDNNSDVTFPDSDMAIMRSNGIVDRNGSTDSPPEPAPPEVPPRGISMHHADLSTVRAPRDILTVSSTNRSVYSVGSGAVVTKQGLATLKEGISDSNPKSIPSQDSHRMTQSAQQAIQNNTHPTLLPVIMPVHTVRNNTVTMSTTQQTHHSGNQQHCSVLPSQINSAHFTATNFQIRKSCSHRCSWKCLAIFLIFVTVLLTAALAYFGAVRTMTLHYLESGTGCIFVEDARLASNGGVESTSPPPIKVPTPYTIRVAPNDHELWPVIEVALDHKLSHTILPHEFWNLQIQQTRASFVRFHLNMSLSANLALFARRHQPPTITQFDFIENIRKRNTDGRKIRSTTISAEVTFLHHLDPGWWYFSFYNDNNEISEVTFLAEIATDVSAPCPQNCNDHGACTLGKCDCYQGYTGSMCEQRLCPVLCSSHGTYSGGVCHCERGWKGSECSVPELDCEVPDCNAHGECHAGFCVCDAGFKGRHCEEVDCLDPLCTNHGTCVSGQCLCRPGWSGHNCSEVDDRLVQCLPNCSEHGSFDLDSGQCICESYWTGPDCSEAFCNADCGPFGKCIGVHCHCMEGWTGAKCDHQLCDPRCAEHGQCNNGTCVCMQGWNGRHCTLEGCPKDCNHHGNCAKVEKEYQCQCHHGWDGVDCGIKLEIECNDGHDNDHDGVIDCADSECCGSLACKDNMMCTTTIDPVDVLYRKQPPAVTASFYQRMKFLIDDQSVQNYVQKDEYSENRVSVIRGRVVNKLGQGLIAIRVGVDSKANFGFTLSRHQGWFDIMVNGGGAVTLQFLRNPFRSIRKTIMVPWNQIVVMDTDVVMVTPDEDLPPEPPLLHPECREHDHAYMKPTVHETWKTGMLGGCPDRRVIYAETQVIQESLEIPGSDLHLLYQSSSSPGYHGTLHIQLTPARIPKTLTVVHLRIIVEGVLFEKRFEADPNVTFTYSWNKRNVYKQKVYGIATAKVSVGYQYSVCSHIIWTTQTATLQGYDMDISEIGGWNLNIHNRYNFHDGILQKGDGTTIYFNKQPHVVQVVMGNGEQRPLTCDDCGGVAKDSKLLAPVALASGPDGSIYVGDFNLVRRILPSGQVQTILTLSATQMSYHYHLAVHPVDGSLYMSSPEKGQILRVTIKDGVTEDSVTTHVETVVGSGERCIVGDHRICGDGGPAREARLSYPKGRCSSNLCLLQVAIISQIGSGENREVTFIRKRVQQPTKRSYVMSRTFRLCVTH